MLKLPPKKIPGYATAWSPNILQASEHAQACNGTALPQDSENQQQLFPPSA
jgi:hypothetical protein